MAVAIIEPAPEFMFMLTDELAPAFLEELERSGSIRGAARALGVDRSTAYHRRYHDKEFRRAWDAIQRRRMLHAADALIFALEDLAKLAGGWENAIDELVNVSFDPIEEPPARPTVDPDRLALARERLSTAGKQWAAEIATAGD
jgi:hypothetical protein